MHASLALHVVNLMGQLAVRLPDDLSERLENLAAKTHRSKAFYVKEALRSALDDLEDIYLADARMEDLKAGRSRTHSLDEVARDLDLED